MDLKIYDINFQIYAESEEEAERGRKAIIQFIRIMKNNNAPVRGNKIAEAVALVSSNPFVATQTISFFKKQ